MKRFELPSFKVLQVPGYIFCEENFDQDKVEEFESAIFVGERWAETLVLV